MSRAGRIGLLSILAAVIAPTPAAAGDNEVINDNAACSALSRDNVAFARALMTAALDKYANFNSGIHNDAEFMRQYAALNDPGERGLTSMLGLKHFAEGVGGGPTTSEEASAAELAEARRESADLVPALVKACADKPNANLLDTIQSVIDWR